MLKVLLRVVGVLVAVILLVIGGLLAKASIGLSRIREIPPRPISVARDSATIARGEHLSSVVMKCPECHAEDLGGKLPFADAGPLGYVNSANLTTGSGGRLGQYDDATLARAIRHGVKHDGSPILIMPSSDFVVASDTDVAAVIAYLRSLPPVERVVAPSKVKLLGRVLYGAGMFPIIDADRLDHGTQPAPNAVPSPTREYGEYLANIGGCTGCHGPGLSGGKIPGTPPDWRPAANITPTGLSGWTEADFVNAMKTGKRPNGTAIDTMMPWRRAGRMDSVEMRAVWLYLRSVPGKPFGGR